MFVPQVEKMCVCAARAWRDVEVIIHTLDVNVKCVLHTCMAFEAAPGIARKASVDACYCKCMTYNFRCSVHAHSLPKCM